MIPSLNGLRILNTRPKAQAQKLTQSIIDAGGVAIECPALEIKATKNDWLTTLPNLDKAHHAIFISANAVHYCFNTLKKHHINWPSHINVIAIGQASAKALAQHHVTINQTPQLPSSEDLLALDSLQLLNNKIVLLFKGIGGRLVIEEELSCRGASVFPFAVYQRAIPVISSELIKLIWQDDLVDVILFTSEQSIHNLFTMFGKEAHDWLQNKPCIVISERLAQSASLFDIKKIVVTHPEQMINALLDFSQGLIHGQ